MKTEMLEREEAIRSKSPVGVAQELWGLALAYNLIRLEMERTAEIAGVPPTRMSFARCLGAIRIHLLRFAAISPGRLTTAVEALHRDLAESYVLLPVARTASTQGP